MNANGTCLPMSRLVFCRHFLIYSVNGQIFTKPSTILSRHFQFFRKLLYDKKLQSSLRGLCIKNLCEPRNFLANNNDGSLSDLPRRCYVTCLEKRERSTRTRVKQVGRGVKIPGIKSPLIPTKTITLLLLGRHPKLWPSHFAVQAVGSYLIFIAVIAWVP